MNNKPKSECSACKKGLNRKYYPVIGISFIMLGGLIYGTVKLISSIITYLIH